jgi:uncharacterized protein YdcH (DUF465 family)
MDTQELFDLAEMLDTTIATLEQGKTYKERCELADLKAFRAHVQQGIEANISAMESATGE